MKYSGAKLFALKATHGLPLEVAVEKIHEAGIAIDWLGFINEARASGWYDFQTIPAIQVALEDSMTDRPLMSAIIHSCKEYVVANPLQ